MEFGVVREIVPQERRVPLTPAGVRALVAEGHEVFVEEGAGVGAGASDTEYLAAGAHLFGTAREVARRAQVLVKVNAPTPDEAELLQPNLVLVGLLSLANQAPELHTRLVEERVTTFAAELLADDRGDPPVLAPMSALGGRVAVTLAAWHLAAPHGPGVLLGGAPGVPPAMVLVIGGGTAGQAAAAEAASMGAQVVVLDKDPRQLHRMAHTVGRVAVTAIASEYHLVRYLEQADVVIGAVAERGRRAPRVMERRHVRMMREGAIFLDMSIDEGGCCETSRPTTQDDPSYEEEGVRHICIPNLTSLVARTASRVLGNALLPYLLQIGGGVDAALARDLALRNACVYHRGALVNRAMAVSSGAPWVDLELRVPRLGS